MIIIVVARDENICDYGWNELLFLVSLLPFSVIVWLTCLIDLVIDYYINIDPYSNGKSMLARLDPVNLTFGSTSPSTLVASSPRLLRHQSLWRWVHHRLPHTAGDI